MTTSDILAGLRTKTLRAAALSILPVLAASGLQAQTTWTDGIGTLFDDDMDPMTPDVADNDGSGNWDDITKWDTGTVPNGVGITVNFKNAYTDSNIQPLIRSDQEPHASVGAITVGILNFEDTAADGNDTNFAYEGETDFIVRGNGPDALLTFNNGGDVPEINFTLVYNDSDVVRFGRDDNLSLSSAAGLNINTAGTIIFDNDNFIDGPIVVRAIDSGPLSDLGDGTNTVPNPGPNGTADGDRSGDGRVQVEDSNAFGSTGPGNETIFMGDGGRDQFNKNNRMEGQLRFNIDDSGAAAFDVNSDPSLDGSRPIGGGGDGGLTTGYTVEEEFYFRYFPAGDGNFARRTWEDMIFVADDVPVTLNGDLHFERGVDFDGVEIGEDALNESGQVEEANVRFEIQVGDSGTNSNAARGAWDANVESLTINGNIIINDQSGGTTTGRFENDLGLQPFNEGSTLTINGAIGSNAQAAADADPSDLLSVTRYQGVNHIGDGTTTFGGDNEFDGGLTILRGTLVVTNEGAVDDAWFLRLGGGGTNPADQFAFFVGAPGTFNVGATGNRPIQFDDIIGNPGAANPDLDAGNELPYILGMNAPGVAILDTADTSYNGDGWNNNNGSQELDNLEVTIELNAVAGAQLEIRSRIQGQELAGDAIDPAAGNFDPITDLGTVILNKTGDGTIIMNPGGSAHQYSGPTNVEAGILLTDGTNQKTTAINVSDRATFGGEGNVGDATDADQVLDRATDGIDNDEDGFADALDPEMDETGLYYDSDGDPLTGPGNYLGGIGSNENAGRVRPKVSVPVTFADGADLEVGLRDDTQTSVTGALNIEGSVTFQGNNELRFNIGGPDDNNAGRDRLNVNNVNLAAAPNGEIVFSGTDTETFVFAETPGLPIEARVYVIITTDNGFSGITLPMMGTGPAGFTYEVRAAGNPNNIVVDVQAVGGSDTDGDLIPDDYENANGLNANDPSDGDSDLDGDGFGALFEYAMGTLAGDATSSPTWEIVHVSDTEVTITYGPITNGVTYNLNASTDGETFSQIDTFTAGADAATNTVTDTTGGLDVELYQLEVPLPLP